MLQQQLLLLLQLSYFFFIKHIVIVSFLCFLFFLVLTCVKPKLPLGLPSVSVAAASKFADVINRVCCSCCSAAAGIVTLGLLPLELRRLNMEKPLLDVCESGVFGDLGSL